MAAAWAQWVQSTALSRTLAGSTWTYPVIGALHVLGLAWFGGAVLLTALRREEWRPGRAFLRIGLAWMLATGVMLVVIEPVRCAASPAFRAKLLLLLLLAATSRLRSGFRARLTLTLWVGVLLAARGIAFF